MSRPRLRSDLIRRRVGADFAVYDPIADLTVLLNPSAAAILELCDGSRSAEAIAAAIADTYEVDRGALGAQVRTALAELEQHGLLECQAAIPM